MSATLDASVSTAEDLEARVTAASDDLARAWSRLAQPTKMLRLAVIGVTTAENDIKRREALIDLAASALAEANQLLEAT